MCSWLYMFATVLANLPQTKATVVNGPRNEWSSKGSQDPSNANLLRTKRVMPAVNPTIIPAKAPRLVEHGKTKVQCLNNMIKLGCIRARPTGSSKSWEPLIRIWRIGKKSPQPSESKNFHLASPWPTEPTASTDWYLHAYPVYGCNERHTIHPVLFHWLGAIEVPPRTPRPKPVTYVFVHSAWSSKDLRFLGEVAFWGIKRIRIKIGIYWNQPVLRSKGAVAE